MSPHDCDTTRAMLSDYVDDALPAADRRRIDEELQACPDCQSECQALRETLGGLQSLRAKAPPTFLADIQGQIHKRSKGRFFAKRWLLFGRIPFEWLSFGMILAMLVYYIVVMQGAPTDVAPGP